MKWDYLIIVVMLIGALWLARYLKWRELRDLGKGSASEVKYKPKILEWTTEDLEKASISLPYFPTIPEVHGSKSHPTSYYGGDNSELGIHNQRDNSSGTARVFDFRAAKTRKVLK